MKNKTHTITVFTTTYNREHLLPRLYQSLCEQTSKNFLWLVVDDGSVDNTKNLVQGWVEKNIINIQYYYKQNGGTHTGHNVAYSLINTELNVSIDSDDYMPKDAIELILNKWDSTYDKSDIAGIIGLDALENGSIVGTKIPSGLKSGNMIDLYQKYGVKGDKKVVLLTEVVRQYPSYPEYENEKLVPPGTLYTMISRDYDFIYSNEVYCIVEYQEEGYSKTIFKQYKQSPRGFAYANTIGKNYSNNLFRNLKQSIHIGSSAIFAKDFSILMNKPKTYQNFIMFPFAILFNMYTRYKIKY